MPLTDAEWVLMKAVWEGAPVTTREVLERIQRRTGWAYTTVKTLLDRLVAKGILTSQKKGNTLFYKPLLSRSRARGLALRELAEKAFDGAFGPMMHFLVRQEELSADDWKELEELILKKETQEGQYD